MDKKYTAKTGQYDFWFVCRKHLWVFLLILICFLFLIPFSTAGLNGSSIFNILVTHEQMKFRLFHESVIPALMIAPVVFGLLTGICLFRFLLDKKETTIFLSLGIRRSRLFANRLLAGCLFLLLGTGIPMLLSYLLNLCALGGYEGLLRNTFYLTVLLFVCAAFSMLVAACAVFLSGTLAEAVVYWAGLISIPLALTRTVNLLFKNLFWGNAWGAVSYTGEKIRPSLADDFTALDPLRFLKTPLETNGAFIRPLTTPVPAPADWTLAAGWLAAALVLAVLAFVFLKYRKAECAGTPGQNRVLTEVVIFISGFPAFAVIFSLLQSFGTGLAVFLSALAFLAVCLFWRKTLFSRTGRKNSFLSVLVQGAVIAALCLVCAFGLKGSAEKMIDKKIPVRAEVTYAGDPSLLYTRVSGSSTGRGYYVSGTVHVESEEALTFVEQIHKELAAAGRKKQGKAERTEDTVVPYDLCFRYRDAEGKESVWYYDRASFSQLNRLLEIEETEEVRSAQAGCLVMEEKTDSLAQLVYQNGEVYLTDPFLSDTYKLTLEGADRQKLLQAVADDIRALPAKDRYFPRQKAKAVLLFTGAGEADAVYFTYHLDNAYLYITEAWQHTLTWLKENSLLELVEEKPQAEYILLQPFDPYIGINGMQSPLSMYFMAYCADTEDEFPIRKDFGNQYRIEEPEECEELLSVLKDGCFMTGGGYLACVKLSGQEKFRYLFLQETDVPAFIRR